VTDEGERFDLVDRDGRPLGRSKPRALVHRDGDWHRSVHIWIWGLLPGGAIEGPHLVLQRRSASKDTWPRALDVAVAGHVRAGETLAETLREAEEEIGLAVRPDEVARLGRRRHADARRPGVLDNELQEILARRAPVAIAALVPDEVELESIVALPFDTAEGVLGRGEDAWGLRLVPGTRGARFERERIVGGDLVPAPDGYYARAYASLAALIAGGAPGAWEIG
jgi:isopentenyldiphosphate isomerase